MRCYFECGHCEALVDAKELSSYESNDPEEGPPTLYTFCKCPKCSSPLLAVQENYGDDWDEQVRIFPPQVKAASLYVPDAIGEAYSEAQRCFRAKSFTAAAIMCRKALEAIAEDHSIRERSLDRSLSKLRERGIIESRIFEWADALRITGNSAAHDVGIKISREDARDILEFTDALLEYVYTYRHRFSEFMERRSRSRDSSEPIELSDLPF